MRRIYERLTTEEISQKVSQLVTPKIPDWNGEVVILFQTIENLHLALPEHTGDWYFTGRYPTPGGYKALNQAYINFFENSANVRSY